MRYKGHTIYRIGLLTIIVTFVLPVLYSQWALAIDAEPYVEAEMTREGGAWFTQSRWSPYLVGIGIGILSWLAFIFSDHPLGVSTAYARSAGMIEKTIRGEQVEQKPYYRKFAPKVDWEWMLVLGLLIGAFLSALTSGDFRIETVPPLWEAAFGYSPVARLIVALLGGWLVGFGARWTGGCTSGHAISGTMQLVISSWLAAGCFFIGGIVAAMIIFFAFA